ncbi:MAG: tRNA pseudouridine(55) synthase TruB [Treponema sp.]|nr:tRNA pseudouridine(55) synthase TruB [Treponema sp.]
MNSGLILLNKKPGITSFDALRDIKRSLGTGKVGHTGTLDKFASGLLIVLVGKALKLSQWFTNCDKKYKGRICFGIETDTLDPEGSIIAKADLPTRELIEDVLKQFRGEIKQIPPVYSAIHINGKRASALAREGVTPEMKKRPVTIHEIELLSWDPPFADVFVHCSSGTYIRSLARDIALAAESRGYLIELERTQVAGFVLAEVENPEKLSPRCGGAEIAKNIKLIDKNVIDKLVMPWFEVTQQEAEYIKHGKPLEMFLEGKQLSSSASLRLCENDFFQQATAVFCGETLVAIIEKNDEKWKYGCVFN